jgi:hypothetical protein
MNIDHFGPCNTTNTATTTITTTTLATTSLPPPVTTNTTGPVDDWEMLLMVFCDPSAPVNCSSYPPDPVCGSDLIIYFNK